MLTREQIKAAKDRPREFVAIPEWTPEGEAHDPVKHGVYVATMSAKDRDAWETFILKGQTEGHSNVRARMAVLTVVDADGNRCFTNDDLGWLGDKACVPVATIFDAACRLNKIGG